MIKFISMLSLATFLSASLFAQKQNEPSWELIHQIQKEFEELERPLNYECKVEYGEKYLLGGPNDWYWITLDGKTDVFASKYTLNELAYSLWKYLDKHDENYYDAEAFIILSGKTGNKYLFGSKPLDYTKPVNYISKTNPGNWDKDEKFKVLDVKHAVGDALKRNNDYSLWEPRKHFFDMTAIVKDKENREKNIAALCAALKDENIKKEYPYEIYHIINILGCLLDKKTIPDIGNFMFYDWVQAGKFVNDKKFKDKDIYLLGMRGNCCAPYILSKFGLDALPTVWEKMSKTTEFDRSEEGGCAIYMALKILEWAKIKNSVALKSLQDFRQSKSFSDEENKALDELEEAIKKRDDKNIQSN